MEPKSLMQLFDFDSEDLLANQRGELSRRQRSRLVREGRWEALASIALGLIVAAVGGAAATVRGPGVALGAILRSGHEIMVGIGIFLIAGGIYLAAAAAATLLPAGSRQMPLQLRRVEGRASWRRRELTTSKDTADVEYRLHVGEKRFTLRKSPQGAIKNGGEYVLYYLEGTETIVAGEPGT